MLIKSINRASPDQIFLICYNSESASTMSVGHAVVFDYSGTTNANGYAVKYIDNGADNEGLFAGCVAEADIVAGEYGLVQCYGHAESISITGSANATTQAAGVAYMHDSTSYGGLGYLLVKTAWQAGTIELGIIGGLVILGETTTVTNGTAVKGFIKAM